MKLILGLLIWIVSILLLGIPLGILTIYKVILIAVNSGRRRQRIEGGGRNRNVSRIEVDNLADCEEEEWFPLAPNDSMLAPDSSWAKSALNFGLILRFKPRENESGRKYFTVEELRDLFANCFLQEDIQGGKYDKLSSYIIARGGHTFRVHQKYIDLKEHIFEVKWNNDGSYQCLEEMLTKWMLLKWTEKKPCWEMILIENPPSSPKELILAFKIHHALADGYSILHILDTLTGNTSPYLVRYLEENTSTKIREGIESVTYFNQMNGYPPEKNPFRVNSVNFNNFEWMVSFTSFPLDGIKEIRRKHEVHVVSIIFAIIIGALRQFALEDLEGKKIPTEIAVATTLPWPNHPSRDPKTRNRDKLCNHWTTGLGKASLDEKDPVLRLKQIEKELQTYQDLGLSKFAKRVLIPLMWTMPSAVLSKMFTKDMGFGAGLTSLVGGDNYSLLGCKVDRIHPFISVQDSNPFLPVSCFTFSHSGVMELTVGVHPSVFKDQETVNKISQEFCQNEFNTLLKA